MGSSGVTTITGQWRSNLRVNRLPPKSVRRYERWALSRSLPFRPQAKGRVERLFNTLQDRLVQELRLAGISTPEPATVFLNGSFKADFNARFAKPAKQTQGAWRPLPKGVDVDRICSFRYEATVGNDNAVRLGGIILDVH